MVDDIDIDSGGDGGEDGKKRDRGGGIDFLDDLFGGRAGSGSGRGGSGSDVVGLLIIVGFFGAIDFLGNYFATPSGKRALEVLFWIVVALFALWVFTSLRRLLFAIVLMVLAAYWYFTAQKPVINQSANPIEQPMAPTASPGGQSPTPPRIGQDGLPIEVPPSSTTQIPDDTMSPNCERAVANAKRQAQGTKTKDWTFWLSPGEKAECLGKGDGGSSTNATDVVSTFMADGRARWSITDTASVLSPLDVEVEPSMNSVTFVIHGRVPSRSDRRIPANIPVETATLVKVYVFEYEGTRRTRLSRFDRQLFGRWEPDQPFSIKFEMPTDIFANRKNRSLTICLGNDNGCFPSTNILPEP